MAAIAIVFGLNSPLFAHETPTPPAGPPAPGPGCALPLGFDRFREIVIDRVLRHVLDEKDPAIWPEALAGGLAANFRVNIDTTNLRIDFQTPRGYYRIGINDQVDADQLGQLVDAQLPRVLVQAVGANGGPQVISTIGVHPTWITNGVLESGTEGPRHLEHLRGLVRAGLAGDAFVHPQQRSPLSDPEARLNESALQQLTIAELTSLYRFSMIDDAGRALRIGLMAPGGIGKTFICARFMRVVHEAEKVIIVVDNNDILDQTRYAYTREFGARLGELLTIYDAHSQSTLDPTRNILLINRTMLNRRWNDVMRWMGKKRTGFVFDEAHHLGRNSGAREFQEIFRRFNTDPHMLAQIAKQDPKRPHYLGLLASATFWHGDTHLILDPQFLGVRNLPEGAEPYGKIYGPLLYDSERIVLERSFFRGQMRSVDMGTEPEALRHGRATPEIARRQLLRAMGLGYLARLSHSDMHRDVITHTPPGGGTPVQVPAFEVVRRIDSGTVRVERTSIAYDLLERVYKQLQGMRNHTDGDVSRALTPEQVATLAPTPNRALVLVRRTQVANEVRDQLQAIAAAHNDPNTEVRTVHSSQGSDPREDTLMWFRNEGPYNTPRDRAANKILVVDSLINEGVDVPDTNAVVLLRPFAAAEEGSVRRLIQVVTRASRTADWKTHMEIIDFSGASEHLRNILAIGTQNYGGGAGGSPGGRTVIEVDIRPGPLSEDVTRVSFINAQPTNLTAFASEVDRWIATRAPFDDARFGSADQPSPLGVQIVNLYNAIPKRQVMGNYYVFDNSRMKNYRDGRFRALITNIGPRIVAQYQVLSQLFDRYRGNNLNLPGRTGDQLAAENAINSELREAWFEMLKIVRDVDFYADREVTMSFSHHDPRDESAGATLAGFFRNVLLWKDLPLLQDGDTGGAEVTRLEVGRVRPGANDTTELIVRGAHAYSYLAGELGTHEVHVREDGRAHTRFVFARVTPPLDRKDPLWQYIDADHNAAERKFRQDPRLSQRRVYNNEAIHRDVNLPSLRIPLARPTEAGGDIDIRDSDETRRMLGRMLRINHYDYLRSTIQDVIVPMLIRGNVGG